MTRRKVAGMRVSFLLGLAGLIDQSSDWTSLICGASLMLALMAPFVLLIGLNKDERDSVLIHPATRVLRFVGLIHP